MSVESDFEDVVKICEFYTDPGWAFHVDWDDHYIVMGSYDVYLMMTDGRLVCYIVTDPEGVAHLVSDLDEYFQREFDWGEL